MIVLGFDTATRATAVGLRLADGSALQARDDPSPEERPGHATRLLALIGGLLAEAGFGWSEIERIAVGVGPGTFTGLRIGVATARGLAQSLQIPLVGVSSLAALAHGARVQADGDAVDGVIAVIDARRGEVFAAVYGQRAGWEPGVELSGPATLAPEGLAGLLERVGADERPERWFAVGDGAARFRGHLEAAGIVPPPDDSPLHRVSGGSICELSLAIEPGDPQAVAPNYGRPPDAEIALERARS